MQHVAQHCHTARSLFHIIRHIGCIWVSMLGSTASIEPGNVLQWWVCQAVVPFSRSFQAHPTRYKAVVCCHKYSDWLLSWLMLNSGFFVLCVVVVDPLFVPCHYSMKKTLPFCLWSCCSQLKNSAQRFLVWVEPNFLVFEPYPWPWGGLKQLVE